ncbi:unannotated protein [freshwater metagenome]|uniref:Unannotated protein n=1 Tax=freshwater metagenome TaxID=449393 RepID=A0A6J7XX89_9ZZZZ|nr:hypothetical protein [Actinomycetota bacterium]
MIRNANKLWKVFLVMIAASVGLGVASSTVGANLNATSFNTSANSIASGTLKLVQLDNGVGFSTPISNMVPGDTVNRYVKYTNSGTLAAKALTVKVADSLSTLLTTDGTKGLQVTISNCSVAWTPGTGACSGTTTSLLTSTSLLSLKSTAGSLDSGSIASGAVYNLKFSLNLPSSNTETTVNGVLPASTIQDLSASLTWTLEELQRDSTETNS